MPAEIAGAALHGGSAEWGEHVATDRAAAAGGRTPDETLEDWVARLGWGRTRSDLLELASGADVADPMGGLLREFRDTRDRLMGFTERLCLLAMLS